MKDKLKNIINLSKIFIKENKNDLKILDEKNKIDKKSLLFWIYIILFFGICYLSIQVVQYTKKLGVPEIFLNTFLLFLEILIILRTIMVSTNVFYFSKEIENILFLPLKPIEILISKFITILFMNYEIEILFGAIPIFIYGNLTFAGIGFFINALIVLFLFPIFATLIVSTIMIILMKTIKVFKNKDLMQFVISFILIFIIMTFIGKAIIYVFQNEGYIESNQVSILNNINEKFKEINNYFLNINPSINILLENNFIKIIINYLKIGLINLIAFLLFYFLGNKIYLKQLLKANFYFKKKNEKEINLNKKARKNSKLITFIKKEFKLIIKHPLFLMQTIYPVILYTIIVCGILAAIIPKFIELSQINEYKELFAGLKFDIEAVCLIVGLTQVIGLFNYCSVTSFSREGKNAYFLKTIPISLYKQYIYKNVPQIVINTICSIAILLVFHFKLTAIENKYILGMFIISFLLTVINSFILSLIDLLMPKLEWDAEYDILKRNKNRLLQYVLIIFNIIFLIVINNLFKNKNLDISLNSIIIILLFIFILFNFILVKNKRKLFKKIN